jgi:hypothetical protein
MHIFPSLTLFSVTISLMRARAASGVMLGGWLDIRRKTEERSWELLTARDCGWTKFKY